MRFRLRDLALSAALLLVPVVADAGPDPAKIRAAADSFEAGARAYKDGKFEEAAGHFEAADMAVPSPKALRLAMRARSEAKQGARAASLAALVLSRDAADDESKAAASEILAAEAPELHRVEVSCASPCLLAAGTRIIHGEAATRWVLFLQPGKEVIGASFLGNVVAPEQSVDAKKGGSSKVRFSLPGGASSAGTGGAGAGRTSGSGGAGASNSAGGSTGEGGAEGLGGSDGGAPEGPGVEGGSSDWRIHPAPFVVSLIATAGLGATAIWSGIDTINNPGADAIRAECKGQGESCPLFQEGQGKETRTNALIGATAGLAALTIVFAIVTDWGGDDAPEEVPGEEQARRPRLWVSGGSAMSNRVGSEDAQLILGLEGGF